MQKTFGGGGKRAGIEPFKHRLKVGCLEGK